MELRFIMRDGKKILQQNVVLTNSTISYDGINCYNPREWQDVPLVEEE